MATQRKVRQYATYGNVAYKVDNTAPARERRREVEQPRRPRVKPRERVATRRVSLPERGLEKTDKDMR